jgi:hypothetical protein
MSEQSQGPGWWRASDGKWYAPEPAPPVPPMVAPVAGGGSNVPKIIVGIVIAVALVAGGTAFALTRDSGGGSVQAFCDKAKTLHNDIDLNDAFSDPTKVDEVVAKFNQLASAVPDEIKADMNTLNDALRSARDDVKAGKSVAFNDELSAKIETANTNVENFGTKNCGADFLLSSSSSDSSSTSIATSPSSSSSSFTSSSSSTGAVGGVTDAVATRDKMIELAKVPGAADASAQPPIAEWTKAFPNLDFIGSALPASPDVVSGFTVVFSKEKAVDFFAFAIRDTHGTCSAGVLEFDSAGTTVTKSVKVNGPSQCSGDAVATSVGY